MEITEANTHPFGEEAKTHPFGEENAVSLVN